MTLGLDIGGTLIKTIALKGDSPDWSAHETPSEAKHGPDALREAIRRAVTPYLEKGAVLDGIGIGCAGSVDPSTGVVRNSPNFADWRNVPLKEWVAKDFSTRVTIDNDANCAVYAEWKLGNAQGHRNVVLLTLGTGIGGGLVLNGRLFRGSTGTGGELGHYSIRADGKPCPCGNRGCFERYCSATALRELSGGRYGAREIFTRRDDAECQRMVAAFLEDFKIGLTSLANIFDPDIILIGGGVAKGVSEYFGELSMWIREHAFPAVGAHVRIEKTKFDNLSGALGAALLNVAD